MKKQKLYLYLILLLSILTTQSFAQTSVTFYYKNLGDYAEVSPEKARYSETVTTSPDGTVTKTRKNLKKNIIEYSETYKGEEPFGIWIYLTGSGPKEKDYDFQLVYSKEDCAKDSLVNIENSFSDNKEKGYVAPVIATGEESVGQFIGKTTTYPAKARRSGIQGTVTLKFNITTQGTLENITVYKGVDLHLDKEAVRVLRKLKLSGPPLLNGQPRSICTTIQVSFKLA